MVITRFAAVFVLVTTLVPTVSAAPKWDFSDYGTRDPVRLFRLAWDSDSPAEKLRIRSWLAAEHSDKPEGLFARAWMAGYEKDSRAEGQLYQECVTRYPTFTPCLINGVNSEINPGGPASQTLLALTPAQLDPDAQTSAVRNAYFYLANTKKDKPAAAAYLARFKAQYPQSWTLDFVEGLSLHDTQPAQAAALYQSAIRKANSAINPDVYENLIDLETGVLYDSAKGSRFEVAASRALQFYRSTGNWRSNALVLALIKNHVNSDSERIAVIRQFENLGLQPSTEVLEYVTAEVVSDQPEWSAKLRKRITERARIDPPQYGWLALHALAADDQPAEATRLYRLAIDGAYAERQRTNLANLLIYRLRMHGDCQASDQEAKALLARYPALNQQSEFFSNWFEAQLCVGDLAGARTSQARRAALGTSAGDLVSDDARLALLVAEQTALRSDQGQAFLGSWQAGTGGRLSLQIEFPTGSAVIPARFDGQLKQVADALKLPQAGDYVFEVAGHTDNTGDAALNLALSQRRAQAVVDHLIQRHGLSGLRLRANGFGPGHPVADNNSEAGRQRNRRVDITPVSSASAPTIARSGKPVGDPSMSPDGRLLVDGDRVLWDTRQWIALRQLPDAYQLEFSRDGRYVLGLTKPSVNTLDTSLWVYSLAANKVVARRLMGPVAAVETFAVAPDGKRLALVNGGLLEVLELPSLKRQGEVQLSRKMGSGVVAWVGNDQVVAAVRTGGQVLHIVQANTLKVERRIEDVDYVHTLGSTPSGRYLVAAPNDGRLLVWDTGTWQRREIPRSQWGRYSTGYRFHPLRDQLVADQWNGSRGHTTVLVDLDTLQVSKPLAEGAGQRAAYAPDGESIYVSGYPIKRLNLRSLQPMALNFPDSQDFSRWTMVTPQGMVGTSLKDQYQLWDVGTARPQHRVAYAGNTTPGQPDVRYVINDDGTVQATDTRTFETSVAGKLPDGYAAWGRQLTAQHWVFSRRIEVKVGSETRAKEAELAIVERASGRLVARHRFPLPTEDFIHSDDEYPLQSDLDVVLSGDGKHVAIRTHWREHWGYPTRSSKVVQIFDLQTGQRTKRLELNKPVLGLEFRPEQPGVLLVRTEAYANRYLLSEDRYNNGYPLAKTDRIIFDDGQRRVLRNSHYITHVRPDGSSQVLPVAGATDGMALPNQNLLLLEFGNELRYYDLKTLSHQLSVLARSNGEWIAYTPDGQYSASPQGTAGLYWSLGEATLPFAALKEKFERPNVIRERLQSLQQGQAVVVPPILLVDSSQPDARPSSAQQPSQPAAQLDTSFFDPPFKLRVIEAPKSVDAPALTLKVGITKTRAFDVEPAIELNVNGQQIDARGLARLEGSGTTTCMDGAAGTALKVGCEAIRGLPLALEEGRNVVVVNAFFKGGRAQPEVVAIERRKAAATGPLPRLWFFGVGVSQYSDPSNNLQYAHRDAEALAATFAKQEGKLYAKVNTKLLLNKDADARTVKAEMNRFLRQASSQDLIVIFLAGHGMQDNDQTLYFMTADSNLAEPYTGIGVSELQDFLRRRPMAQKALLLLDICHAGAAAGQVGRRGVPSGDDVVNQLANGTGVKVLASSQGREFSLEQPNFRGGHGAFTAALLEGLEGKARSGTGSAVSVLDLERYVSRRVPEITQGKQHPTAPDSNNFQDYPLSVQ